METAKNTNNLAKSAKQQQSLAEHVKMGTPRHAAPPVAKRGCGKYPNTQQVEHTDVYTSHKEGIVRVRDPYNWLEEDTAARKNWLEQQDKLTRSVLTQVGARDDIKKAIWSAYDYDRFYGLTFQSDRRWYWHYIGGSMARGKIYRSNGENLPLGNKERLDATLYFDINQLSKDGLADITVWSISPNGEYFAYAISPDQRDDVTIYVRPSSLPYQTSLKHTVEDHGGFRVKDVIEHCRFTEIAWTKDSGGFFYQKFQDGHLRLFYHKLKSSTDTLVLKESEEDKSRVLSWTVFDRFLIGDHPYLVVSVGDGTAPRNKIWICDLEDPANKVINNSLKWKRVINKFESEYFPTCLIGTKFYFRTNHNADRCKIVMLDIAGASYGTTDVIAEDKDAVLLSCVSFNNDMLAVVKKRKLYDELYIYFLASRKAPVRLHREHKGPIELGYVGLDQTDPRLLVGLRKFTQPIRTTLHDARKDMEKSKGILVMRATLEDHNSSQFIIEDKEFLSKDNTTKVPITIIRHKLVPCDGTAHALLYAYGGFGSNVDQGFQPDIIPCLSMFNIIFAIAYIRGGGELGEGWHRAGKGSNKKNGFDDLASAGDFLVSEHYTSRGKITIQGASNGGLVVGATYNMARQGLFGAAIARVGPMDLIRYPVLNKDSGWEDEYGDPSDPKMFDYINSYSPYHNVAKLKIFPSIMLVTGSNDDTVNPAHSYKHIARLQELCAGKDNTCLLRLDKEAGHGISLTTEQDVEATVDIWCFIVHTMGLSPLKGQLPGHSNSSALTRTEVAKLRLL